MKRLYRRFRRGLALLLAAMCLMAVLPLRSGASDTPRVVRVGVADTPYFSQKQPDGSFQGILVDYLQQISKYAGWEIEYVEGTLEEEMQMLDDGRIDLLGGMLRSDYISQRYNYSEYSCGYSYTTINALKSNKRLQPMDYDTLEGARIGVYSKAVNRIAAYKEFLQTNDLRVTTVYYDTHAEFDLALGAGQVDAILTNDTSRRVDQRTVARFDAVPYYFVVKKTEPALLRELNRAMNTLMAVDPQFNERTYERHVDSLGLEVTLDAQEQQYVAQADVLSVAVLEHLAPIAYVEDGKARGVAVDVLEMISRQTGLRFQYVPAADMAQARDLLVSGQVSLVAGLCAGVSDGEAMVFTQPFLQSRDVMVQNSASAVGERRIVALPRGDLHEGIPESAEIAYYATAQDCIQQVVSGAANYTVLDALVVDRYTYLRSNEGISLTPMAGNNDGLRFSLKRPADPMLISIFDESIHRLSDAELQSALYDHTTRDVVEVSLRTLIYANPITFALLLSGVFAVLLLAAAAWLLFSRTRLKLARETMLNNESYRIVSELLDEHIYYYEYPQARMSLSRQMVQAYHCPPVPTRQEIEAGDNPLQAFLLSVFWPPRSEPETVVESGELLLDGEKTWLRVASIVISDKAGHPLRGIGRVSDIRQEVQEKQDLTDQAHTDFLTGLYNRQHCEQLIRSSFDADRAGGGGALLVMDIDHFKQINDTLGHLGGDRVLQKFASLLASEFTSQEVVGRWGGDEFIAYIPQVTDRQALLRRADRLCRRIAGDFEYEGQRHALSISVGIACTAGVESFSQLFQKADQALYHVKTTTRNGYWLEQ